MHNIRSLRLNMTMTSLFFIVFIPWSDALAQWGNNQGWHMGPGMMGGGGIFMIGFWILILALICIWYRYFSGRSN